MLADATRMRADFVAETVLFPGDVLGLFQQRQIDVAFDVALSAWIAISVPSASEVAALLDDADVLDPGLAQTRRGQEAAEAATHDHHVDRVGEGLAGEAGVDMRIVDIVAEVGGDLDVLVIGLGAQPPVASWRYFSRRASGSKSRVLLMGLPLSSARAESPCCEN